MKSPWLGIGTSARDHVRPGPGRRPWVRWALAVTAVVLVAQADFRASTRQGEPPADSKIAALIAAVQRESWPRQAAVIEALGATGDPRAVEPLAALLESRAWYVRDAATRAIGQLAGQAAVRALAAALGDAHGQVRQSAREALASRGEPAVATAVAALGSDAAIVRWQAVWILSRLKGPRAAAALLEAFERGDRNIRVEAGVGLARGGAATPVPPLIRLLSDRQAAVREEAAWVLGRLGSPQAAGPLVSALADVDTGWMAAMALGELRTPSAATPLTAALRSPSARTRRAAAWALDRLGTADATPALSRALGDSDEEVRYWAGRGLRRAGRPEEGRTASAQPTRWDRDARRCVPDRSAATVSAGTLTASGQDYPLYPETLETEPQVPSPLAAADGTELVVAATSTGRFGIIPVTLKEEDRQCDADATDFPTLARSGLHADVELDQTRAITGRSVVEIAEFGRPGYLSDDGFLEADEDIVSILRDDNAIVKTLGLTHPDLARPLFHIWNMMNVDLGLNRWNMAEHRWGNVTAMLSHGRRVRLNAGDTKGGQLSIFADGIEGSFWIEIAGDLTEREHAFLKQRYDRLDARQMDSLIRALTRIRAGEMHPHYITWYGFYEGRTHWRTDPIAIALTFGLRTLEEIEAAFPGRLYEVVMARHVEAD